MRTRIDPRDPKDRDSYERRLAEAQRERQKEEFWRAVERRRLCGYLPLVDDSTAELPIFLRKQA